MEYRSERISMFIFYLIHVVTVDVIAKRRNYILKVNKFIKVSMYGDIR